MPKAEVPTGVRSSRLRDKAIKVESNGYFDDSSSFIWLDYQKSPPSEEAIKWNGHRLADTVPRQAESEPVEVRHPLVEVPLWQALLRQAQGELAEGLLPDHTQLPAEDGTFVKNFQEHPQSILLTDSIRPLLEGLHPDGQYAIGQDCGIYWRLPSPPEQLVKGAEAPDWFYVPEVPPLLDGKIRRSYVLWREQITPQVVMEFVSGNGSEERDKTPVTGKFWVYEQAIGVPFYAIYEVNKKRVELYRLNHQGSYSLVPANQRGHYPIEPLGIEIGIWEGLYQNAKLPWLRVWDIEGNLLLTGEERALVSQQQAQEERQRAQEADQRAYSERQRAQEADQRAYSERQRAEEERQRAEEADQRAEEERQRAEEADQRAEEERQRAEKADQRAEEADQRAERLAAQLRAAGFEPEDFS